MNNSVTEDMTWSSLLFATQVWPIIQRDLGDGTLLQMEGRPDQELARELDMRSGIDAWHLTSAGGMRGIASRIQQGGKVYNTFTVRMSRDSGARTEFIKRKEAICGTDGSIYPHITVQAYAKTRTGPILSAAVCFTRDLIKFIDDGHHEMRRVNNADFAACHWKKMREHGIRVKVKILRPDRSR